MTIDEFNVSLDRTLDHDCRFTCAMQDPPQQKDVDALHQELGVRLPPEYVAFQLRYGAAYFEVKEEVWPRPRPYAAGPYWSFLYACCVLGIGEGVPEFLDIRRGMRKFTDDFGPHLPFRLIPVFRWIGSADRICADDEGRLFEVSHETPQQPELIKMSFLEHLATSLKKLVENKARLRTEAAFLFETDQDRLAKRRAAAEKDAALTERRCPQCDSPCPSYRKTCKVCGFAIVAKIS
jgi:hypothetical protein